MVGSEVSGRLIRVESEEWIEKALLLLLALESHIKRSARCVWSDVTLAGGRGRKQRKIFVGEALFAKKWKVRFFN